MRQSIIQEEKCCYFCGRVLDLQRHHVFFGTANRRLSEEDGLTVYLCIEHHTGNNGVHHNKDLDDLLKRVGEKAYMRYYKKTKEDFIARYGKNYL